MHPKRDKFVRLHVASTHIRNGTVLFSQTGCEELIQDLLNFGAESHDDLVDGPIYFIDGLTKVGLQMPKIM